MVFVRQKEAETVPANGGFSRVGERSETRLVFLDRFVPHTNHRGHKAVVSKVEIRPTFSNVLFGLLQLHMGSPLRRFCRGSPGGECALPSDQGEHLLLVSADVFLHNAEVQVQTCRCIPAESFDFHNRPPPTAPPGACCDRWMGKCA